MEPTYKSPVGVRILEATEDILRESGMSGTGIKDVVARSGAPIGSLYHYFPGGKTQLVAESLKRHAARVPVLLERFFDALGLLLTRFENYSRPPPRVLSAMERPKPVPLGR